MLFPLLQFIMIQCMEAKKLAYRIFLLEIQIYELSLDIR